MSVKGFKWRKDVDYKKYWTNYNSLSGERESGAKKIEKKKNGRTTFTYK